MVIVVILISLLTVLPLLASGYFPMHDDLQVMRLFELEKCFSVGDIPCRWASDMAGGYGQAMFNFYSAFPYYLGHLIRLVSPFSIIDTVKILFAISLIASGVGMYFLAREFFGKAGGFIASVFYVFAPYRALNVYVRGAMAEAFSLAILPFLWLAVYKVIKKPTFLNVVFLAIITALQLTTHNISTMIYAIPTGIWIIYLLIREFSARRLFAIVLGGILGFGLAGFFILPVLFEKSLTQESVFTSNYSHYIAHYVSLYQVFTSRFWGYGGSIFGENDHMAFQLGWPHWWVAAFVALFSIVQSIKARSFKFILPLALVALALFVVFLTHSRSTFIWLAVPSMAFIQFPWRLLGLAVFLISFAIGAVNWIKNTRLKQSILVLGVFLAVSLNIQYFKPEMHFYGETDSTKLSGELFITQQKAALLDYLPLTVTDPPLDLAPDQPEIVEGSGEVANFSYKAGTFFFDLKAMEDSTVNVPIIYFPGWKAYLIYGQGEELPIAPSDKTGLIQLKVEKGEHMIEGRFENTPIRNLGNFVSILAFLVILGGVLVVINKNETA